MKNKDNELSDIHDIQDANDVNEANDIDNHPDPNNISHRNNNEVSQIDLQLRHIEINLDNENQMIKLNTNKNKNKNGHITLNTDNNSNLVDNLFPKYSDDKTNIESFVKKMKNYNVYLRNFNSIDNDLVHAVEKNITQSDFDQKIKLIFTNVLKYIKLGDKLLHQDNQYKKALETYKYSLNILDELAQYPKLVEDNKIANSKKISKMSSLNASSITNLNRNIVLKELKLENILINECSCLTDRSPNNLIKKFDSSLTFLSNFTPKFMKILIDNEDHLLLLKQKILHSISFIYSESNNSTVEEEIIDKLLAINKGDFYALFRKSFLLCKKNKFSECQKCLEDALANSEDEGFSQNLTNFMKMIGMK
jgi:tetratricopeptide (TPR) repeat protein